MEITEVRISPSKGGKVRAFASVVFDDCFIVNDLRVMEGREGQLFVTMPARKVRNGQMRDIAHPLNSETRRGIEDRVLEEYHQAVEVAVVVGQRRDQGRGGGPKRRESVLGRLASRLFTEDFWVGEPSRAGVQDNED